MSRMLSCKYECLEFGVLMPACVRSEIENMLHRRSERTASLECGSVKGNSIPFRAGCGG